MNDLNVIGQKGIRDLPGRLYLRIRDILNYQDLGWQQMAAELDGDFTMLQEDTAKIEQADNQGDEFILFLISRDMTIEQLVYYARRARLNIIVGLFQNATVPAVITSQPFHEMNVTEGEPVEMKVEADGFPPPRYQWYKDGQPIINESSNMNSFNISSVKLSDSGAYRCTVNNSPNWDNVLTSNPVNLCVTRAKPMEIKDQPNSFTVSKGGNAIMKCDVWGEGPIQFQWMKDEQNLTDGPHFQGSLCKELRIYNIDSKELTGCYRCQIRRNDDILYTNNAVLQLSRDFSVRRYTATDKVALLMGAGDYRSDSILRAPEHDVKALAEIFLALNFKVVSLYNLTKLEMIAAIDEFKHLVGEGVYCVFYFCGHGFEASNLCFLVPPDAPQGYDHSHCLSADDILFNILLPQKPKVCCMILDICRKIRDGRTNPEIVQRNIQTGNHIVCYGTSQGLAAYEEKTHGILVNHLKKILTADLGIEAVFQKLRNEISQDPKLKEKNSDEERVKQIPEVLTNLAEAERAFNDPIAYKGYTEVYQARQRAWERAHEKPGERDITVSFPDFQVKIRLTFQQEFSNVLKIYTQVLDPGRSFSCQAYISAAPLDVASQAKVYKIQSGTQTELSKTYVTLYDIHRLKSDMHVEITVSCQTVYGTEVRKVLQENLGLPLVAPLKLWLERSILPTRGDSDQ